MLFTYQSLQKIQSDFSSRINKFNAGSYLFNGTIHFILCKLIINYRINLLALQN